MTSPRLFLVTPEAIAADQILACVQAACAAGDVASIVTPESSITEKLQALGLAVVSPQKPQGGNDGVHVDAAAMDIGELRKSIGKDKILGVYCAASRHAAMEAAEAGADYIAFSQNAYAPKEPIIGWWADLFEIPCVAFDPVEPKDLDILLPQNPDFIRPSDLMWTSPAEAKRVIAELTERMTA